MWAATISHNGSSRGISSEPERLVKVMAFDFLADVFGTHTDAVVAGAGASAATVIVVKKVEGSPAMQAKLRSMKQASAAKVVAAKTGLTSAGAAAMHKVHKTDDQEQPTTSPSLKEIAESMGLPEEQIQAFLQSFAQNQ